MNKRNHKTLLRDKQNLESRLARKQFEDQPKPMFKAATLYAYPLIDELQPQIIIAMGKKAANIPSIGGRSFSNLITWNRAQAATPAGLQERAAAAAQIFRTLGQAVR